jgi:hypothetical protein
MPRVSRDSDSDDSNSDNGEQTAEVSVSEWIRQNPAQPPRHRFSSSTIRRPLNAFNVEDRRNFDRAIANYSKKIKDFDNKWAPFIKNGQFYASSRDPIVANRLTKEYYKQYSAEQSRLVREGNSLNKTSNQFNYQISKVKALTDKSKENRAKIERLQQIQNKPTLFFRKEENWDKAPFHKTREKLSNAPYLQPWVQKAFDPNKESRPSLLSRGVDRAGRTLYQPYIDSGMIKQTDIPKTQAHKQMQTLIGTGLMLTPGAVGSGSASALQGGKLFGITRTIKNPKITNYRSTTKRKYGGITKQVTTPEGRIVTYDLMRTIKTPFGKVALKPKPIAKIIPSSTIKVFPSGAVYGKGAVKPIKEIENIYKVKGYKVIKAKKVGFGRGQVTRRTRISGELSKSPEGSTKVFIAKTRGGKRTGRGVYQEIKAEKLGKVIEVNPQSRSRKGLSRELDVYAVETKEAQAVGKLDFKTKLDYGSKIYYSKHYGEMKLSYSGKMGGEAKIGKLKPVKVELGDNVFLKDVTLKIPTPKQTKVVDDLGYTIIKGRKGSRTRNILQELKGTQREAGIKAIGENIVRKQITTTGKSLQKQVKVTTPQTIKIAPASIRTSTSYKRKAITGRRQQQRSALESQFKVKSMAKLGVIPISKTGTSSRSKYTTRIGQMQKQGQKQGQKQKQKLKQKQRLRTAQTLTTPKIEPVKFTFKPILAPIPVFSKKTRKPTKISPTSKKRKKSKAMFRPSLVGLTLPSIKLKQPKIYTGLETRRRR